MTIEQSEFKEDGVHIFTLNGKTYEVDPADQHWLREQIDSLTFGRVLRSHRLCEEWTQEETAVKLGIKKQLLSEYERGVKLPSIRTAYRMAEILGIPTGQALRLLINDQLKRDNIPYKVRIDTVAS